MRRAQAPRPARQPWIIENGNRARAFKVFNKLGLLDDVRCCCLPFFNGALSQITRGVAMPRDLREPQQGNAGAIRSGRPAGH
mmetsp:Transcript_53385/g.172434  ORF Transcript_53385/g.172434 Transcript_53385/m.172434 type:complete len:82 (+) Transcript_53385:2217-2462(+)